jgi:hypothetical protein
MSYVKEAKVASNGVGPTRKSHPIHANRLSSTTGVRGVHRCGAGRVRFAFLDGEGKTKICSEKDRACTWG